MVDLRAKPFFLGDEGIAWVEAALASMSLDEKIGQLFCPIGMTDDEAFLLHLVEHKRIGGILFRAMEGERIQRAHRFLQAHSRIPLLTAANVETGGDGIATDGTAYGSQMGVAAANDASFAYELGEIAAKEGAAVGLNWAFGPVADIDLNYRNPITNVRTFGSDPERVLQLARAASRGLWENGLAPCIKHFPGDGADDRDQHLLTSVNTLEKEAWENSFGKVYRALIDEGALSVMAGHIMLPAFQKERLPASLSKELLLGLLRNELGFNGLIVSDATPMVGFCCAMERRRAVPYAIEAGCDMFLFNKDMEEDFAFMKQGVEEGLLSKERLHDALTRILGMKAAMRLHEKQRLGTLVPGEAALRVVGCEAHKSAALSCADRAITLVRDAEGILPLKKEAHRRILLEVLGDFPSSARVRDTALALLKNEGFEVTVYEPEDMFSLESRTERFGQTYDLVLYLANIETASNKTVSRIHWHTLFGSGNNVPWFVKEVPTVFASVGNPYLLQDVPMIGTFVNAYSNGDIVLERLFDKLLGRSDFAGQSPVDPYCGREELKAFQ